MALRIKRVMIKGFGKQGIFFTLIAITIVTLFLLFASMQREISIKETADIARSRIVSTNNFANSLEEEYIPRLLSATGQKALDGIIRQMISDNLFRKNISEDMKGAIMNGTILDLTADQPSAEELEGGAPAITVSVMSEEETIMRWLDKLTAITLEELNLESEYHINSVILDQTTPWTAQVTANMNYSINSTGVVAIKRENIDIAANFSILGFIDPYIAISTYNSKAVEDGIIEEDEARGNRITRKIMRASEPAVIRNNELVIEWKADTLKEMIKNGSYRAETLSAPSFVMRLENNTNRSECCGIESFVQSKWEMVEGPFEGSPRYDKSQTADTQKKRSFLDYQYWSVTCYEAGDDTQPGGFQKVIDDVLNNDCDPSATNCFRQGRVYYADDVTDEPPDTAVEGWSVDAWEGPDPLTYNLMMDEFHFDNVFGSSIRRDNDPGVVCVKE